ncbi:heparinase II/III family protein [Acetobacter sicerae]|uniref:Heparinase II/III family protein n=1 Tax=Acetobacter sicerae TaxID=85325 RepID=A0ABS8VSM8_9PROT|nr:heparinase II/III family protein [Acetobacter sicerae]MCE0742998.1 heparinase II/III family protein [Acetobacter sicerae]
MGLGRWWRDARLSFALLGPLGGLRSIPSTPAQTVRDLWPGDAGNGELLVRGTASHGGETISIRKGIWSDDNWSPLFRDWFQSFEWLRDLRELGSESARAQARALVADWIAQPIGMTPLEDSSTTGARIAAWLAQYDFFAASADEDYRRALLQRIVLEARTLAAILPTERHDWTALRGLKGLLATAVAIPEQKAFLARYMRLIDPELEMQILPDGCHASRSPGAQLLVLRELAEMRLMLQSARIPMPTTLASALDRMAPVLRAFRHGDGRLALFNGTWSHEPTLIDLIIARAMPRGNILARNMRDGRFVRATSGNTVLFVDAGGPPPSGFDALAHGGLMSMELSSGRSQIVVNCGASPRSGWHEALRDAPAHSVLSIPACPPVLWRRDGSVDVRPDVTWEHSVSGIDHMIELASDCYRPVGCGSYRRRMFLSGEGTDLRGEDRLDTAGDPPEFVLRFHLHPSVRVELEETDILLHAGDEVWKFRSDGYSTIEDSIYFGFKEPTPTQQIVVRPSEVSPVAPAAPADSQSESSSSHPAAKQDEQTATGATNQPSEVRVSESAQDEKELIPLAKAIEEAQEADGATDQEKDRAPLDDNTASEDGQINDQENVSAESDSGRMDEVSDLERPVQPPVPPVLANAIRWAFTRLDA